MKYWWVNHKQTHSVEISNGYIWSPKKEKNGSRSQFYENLTRVKPCDIIFSYANAKIMAVGVASDIAREQTKPLEFESAGGNWADAGWLVSVEWEILRRPLEPKNHIEALRPLLPNTHSPIRENGYGNQKCYLAEISKSLADLLLSLAGTSNPFLTDQLDELEGCAITCTEQREIIQSNLSNTVKEQLVKARMGQGLFRHNVMLIESKCRLTGVSNPSMLIASHIKPWKESNNQERLDGQNGLLLSPHVDKLFDRGWITFSDDNRIITSSPSVDALMREWGLDAQVNVGLFTAQQKGYLAYHRERVFKAN